MLGTIHLLRCNEHEHCRGTKLLSDLQFRPHEHSCGVHHPAEGGGAGLHHLGQVVEPQRTLVIPAHYQANTLKAVILSVLREKIIFEEARQDPNSQADPSRTKYSPQRINQKNTPGT